MKDQEKGNKMKPFVIKIKTNSRIDGSLITGRNGTHNLAAIRIERYLSGSMAIDGVGRSGKTLNAGFYLTQHDADKFLRGLKDAGIIT